jgi:hypothetical protein
MGVVALALLVGIAGCGRQRERQESTLTFEERTDTTGLSRGAPILTRVEPYRMPNGVLRIRGRVEMPDGVRIEVSIYRMNPKVMVSRLQVLVANRSFDSPPILGPNGPLPRGAYRFEYLALFNEAWQTPEVLERTAWGRNLRGPGVTRDRVGGAAFSLVEERTL